jgi:hypothetical protein
MLLQWKFNYFKTVYTWFAGLHHHFYSAGFSCDLLRGRTGGSLNRPNLDCREGWGAASGPIQLRHRQLGSTAANFPISHSPSSA